jgi:hypothetical protein
MTGIKISETKFSANEWVGEWVSEWVSEWVHAWVRDWLAGWVREWMNEWACDGTFVVSITSCRSSSKKQILLLSHFSYSPWLFMWDKTLLASFPAFDLWRSSVLPYCSLPIFVVSSSFYSHSTSLSSLFTHLTIHFVSFRFWNGEPEYVFNNCRRMAPKRKCNEIYSIVEWAKNRPTASYKTQAYYYKNDYEKYFRDIKHCPSWNRRN